MLYNTHRYADSSEQVVQQCLICFMKSYSVLDLTLTAHKVERDRQKPGCASAGMMVNE